MDYTSLKRTRRQSGGGEIVLISPRRVEDYGAWNDRFLANVILRSRAAKNLVRIKKNPSRTCHCEEPVGATPVLSEAPDFVGAKPKDLNLRARKDEIASLRSQ